MKSLVVSLLLLCLNVETGCATGNSFFISAPKVFHKGVREKVFVQMGDPHLNLPITLYLEHESSGAALSEKITIRCTSKADIKTVELMMDNDIMSTIPPPKEGPTYLLVVAESTSFPRRKSTRALVSKHSGYIFIQTNQPIYQPEHKVIYRIFTLDHTLRPNEETFSLSIYNAAGNRVMNSLKFAVGGIYSDSFQIPDVSQPGTWRITAHYPEDEAYAVSREFKVQKFVLPSFEVNIQMEQKYILLSAVEFVFTISAMYTHGEKVKGAYHSKFGVLKKSETAGEKVKPFIINGLELTGSVQNGTATVSVLREKLDECLRKELNLTLSDLQQSGAQIYMAVFVTNINSGEIQDAEVKLPIFSHTYTMDLSRTRSYFIPGFPVDVVLIMRLPDGSPAPGVGATIAVTGSSTKSKEVITGEEGAVFHSFNIDGQKQSITVEVSANGLHQTKILKQASSASGSYLYMEFNPKLYSVNEDLSVMYRTNTGSSAGFIYYMVLSRGIIVKKGSLPLGSLVSGKVRITHDMVPSFRLIGYFYNDRGNIIADSVWVDVREECEINVKVKQTGNVNPGKGMELEFDLNRQRAKVALLAVDKAFYALKADNKLTAKQVFSAMQSYDQGCSHGGGSDSESVFGDAGLTFMSQTMSLSKLVFGCESASARKRRSVNLQLELMTLKSNFSDEGLQECCSHGLSHIPMTLTCERRAKRVSQVGQTQSCVDAFLQCCRQGERLRQEKIREEARKGVGRTESIGHIEEFFMDTTGQYIRQHFPPSFEFKEFYVDGTRRYTVTLPDSITTWEFQVTTISAATGFCVVKPTEVRVSPERFVSLPLPYSVKVFEQMFISPVIYNYGLKRLQLAVHMEQSEGLCSPGSATTASYVNITVEPESSRFVTFSAVPMVTGSIPIKIRVYDIVEERGVDAIKKNLNVKSEGFEHRVEETRTIVLDGRSAQNVPIDGTLPNEVIPRSESSLFISAEADGFQISAKNLLDPEKVSALISLPDGCLEQTMKGLAPTASALRYLDLSEQWIHLPTGTRDQALDNIIKGYIRILGKKKPNGSYGAWYSVPSSNWVTALVVKVLSLVAQRQTVAFGTVGRMTQVVPTNEITQSVRYLLSVQNPDGSFTDPHPVLHRNVLNLKDQPAAMTAFITLSLQLSRQFLPAEYRNKADASISTATTYLMSNIKELEHPYAVAITTYCLAVCQPASADLSQVWTQLRSMATEGKNGYLWTTDTSSKNQEKADTITVETTAYGLLAAVALGHRQDADKAARWLVTQQNYFGGYTSSQDTIMALQALAEYELQRQPTSNVNVSAQFTVPGKLETATFTMESAERVETDLKKLTGNKITMHLSGKGTIKIKTMKAYYLLNPKDDCAKLSMNVTVEGKVKYTAPIIETYEYYDYTNNEEQESPGTQSDIKSADDHTRTRRDVDNNVQSSQVVTYTVCVSRQTDNSLTGMAIADITLLSGFEADIENLEKLKQSSEQYISHYESHHGRVLIYFNQLFEAKECINFDARQTIPIGLLQPAPAVFYDYYEPSQKCTVFYSAPQRTKLVSTLCSGDVCQCAERPCLKLKMTFKSETGGVLRKTDRSEHACFFPTVDYAYIVDVIDVTTRLNFDLYSTRVTNVLRANRDMNLHENPSRLFAKRRQCKVKLTVGTTYLIMGKDGDTTDSNGQMQYLLESNTWVEKKPLEDDCIKSDHKHACRGFTAFVNEYKLNGCTQ